MSVRFRALRAFVAAAVVPCLACGAGTSSDGGVASCPAPNIIGPLGFDNDSIAPQSAQDGWYLYADTTGRIVSDPTARGGRSYQMSYALRPGADQGSAIWAVFAPRPQRRVYARMRYKQDASFDNSGIKKLIRFQGPNGLVGSLIVLWGRFALAGDALSDGSDRYINVGGEVTPNAMRGGWHTLELMADLTGGSPRYQLWIDGQLKMNHALNHATGNATIEIVHFGGTFNAPGATTRDWMDDLATSTQCIGTN